MQNQTYFAVGWDLSEINLDDLRQIMPGATEEMLTILGVEGSIASRTSHGGPAADAFARQLSEAERLLTES